MDTILAAIVPAVLLAQAATLLGRANEIDLSLDQQCFFVAVTQICLFKVLPGALVAGASVAFLCLILTLRIVFNRHFNTIPMIVSIAVGMMLLGLAYVLIWLITPNNQTLVYPTWTTLKTLAVFSSLVSLAIWLGDLFVSSSYQVKVPIRPIGSLPGKRLSLTFVIAPAAILTTLAASVLALHAESITLNFSQNFGILGATTSMIAFGRISKATFFGLFLGLLYLFGLHLGDWSKISKIQSFVVPILCILIVAIRALFTNRT